MGEYYIPYDHGESEYDEKRSRFLGDVFRVESEEEARARIEDVRRKYYDARHHCWCYLLHGTNIIRYSDDGEPQGTAGQPMLAVFQREGVENVVCVVTRYFGGILLGAGGLTRAYGKAAKSALDAAGRARMCPWRFVRVPCPYPLFERFKLLVAAHDGVTESTEYGAEIVVTLRLPAGRANAFAAALTELSLGKVSAEPLGEKFLPGIRE